MLSLGCLSCPACPHPRPLHREPREPALALTGPKAQQGLPRKGGWDWGTGSTPALGPSERVLLGYH